MARANDDEASALADDEESKTASQLRQALREKNDKISQLTAEFDAHRADFRSTLDSLEMASTETERVYEEQKRDLLAQLEGMQQEMMTLSGPDESSREDFEGVAEQLKRLMVPQRSMAPTVQQLASQARILASCNWKAKSVSPSTTKPSSSRKPFKCSSKHARRNASSASCAPPLRVSPTV